MEECVMGAMVLLLVGAGLVLYGYLRHDRPAARRKQRI
jgi:hypothetical protein